MWKKVSVPIGKRHQLEISAFVRTRKNVKNPWYVGTYEPVHPGQRYDRNVSEIFQTFERQNSQF
jgi:hypothetical protein